MPLIGHHVEWSVAILIRGRHSCALLDQEACYIEVPKPRCHGQGSLLFVTPTVNICATIDQQLRDVEVPIIGRKMQRSPAIFCLCIHIAAAVYQETCEVNVSTP